mgnify:FL=1
MYDVRPTPYVASLRVFEPVEVFPEYQQKYWSKIQPSRDTFALEQRRALTRPILDYSLSILDDEVHVIEIDSKRYCCPWSTLNRCFYALYDFKAAIPHQVFKYFVQEGFETSVNSSRPAVENKICHVKTETWNIPPRWFGLFKPEERKFGHNKSGAFTYIQTNVKSAIKRCDLMHKIVVGVFGSGPIEQEIQVLKEWLINFDPRSIVELDYGGLATFLEKILIEEGLAGLAFDSSIEDLQLSLAGLASADGKKAGLGYEKLISRWRKVASYEQAS